MGALPYFDNYLKICIFINLMTDACHWLKVLYHWYRRYISGGPEITEQSIQSIFQDFALINSYFLRLFG